MLRRLFYVYKSLINNSITRSVLDTMSGAVTAVLLITVYNMTKKALSKNTCFGLVIFLLALLLGTVYKINAIYIILSSALSGLLFFSVIDLERDKNE